MLKLELKKSLTYLAIPNRKNEGNMEVEENIQFHYYLNLKKVKENGSMKINPLLLEFFSFSRNFMYTFSYHGTFSCYIEKFMRSYFSCNVYSIKTLYDLLLTNLKISFLKTIKNEWSNWFFNILAKSSLLQKIYKDCIHQLGNNQLLF